MPTRTLSRAEGLSLGLVLTILAALADWYFNQPVVVPPQPTPVVVTVDPAPAPPAPAPVVVPPVIPPAPTVAPELVIVTDSNGVRISDKAIEEVAVKLAVGTWTVVAIPAPGQKGFTRTITVSDGVKPPVVVPPAPTPVPPGPTPPVPPEPQPPPPQPGLRQVLIIRETAETTPDFARLLTALRAGPQADYLKQHGHTLHILDDDSVDQDGHPSALVEAWRPHFSALNLPALLIIDPATKAIVHKESMTAGMTAEVVIAQIKAAGG